MELKNSGFGSIESSTEKRRMELNQALGWRLVIFSKYICPGSKKKSLRSTWQRQHQRISKCVTSTNRYTYLFLGIARVKSLRGKEPGLVAVERGMCAGRRKALTESMPNRFSAKCTQLLLAGW